MIQQIRTAFGRVMAVFCGERECYYINGAEVLPPPLTAQEESDILERFEEDRTLADTLISRNLRLVVYIAKKFEGCGTGIELGEYFKLNMDAKVTGIDLAPGMLGELKRKLSNYDVTTVLGSYFDVPFGEGIYDAAVSVESLHHFTKKAKVELYKKLHASLKDGGYYILTDYLIDSDEEEEVHMSEYNRLRGLQGKHDGELYHFDTPLTAAHECEALKEAGFSSVEVLRSFGNTKTIKATK